MLVPPMSTEPGRWSFPGGRGELRGGCESHRVHTQRGTSLGSAAEVAWTRCFFSVPGQGTPGRGHPLVRRAPMVLQLSGAAGGNEGTRPGTGHLAPIKTCAKTDTDVSRQPATGFGLLSEQGA